MLERIVKKSGKVSKSKGVALMKSKAAAPICVGAAIVQKEEFTNPMKCGMIPR